MRVPVKVGAPTQDAPAKHLLAACHVYSSPGILYILPILQITTEAQRVQDQRIITMSSKDQA